MTLYEVLDVSFDSTSAEIESTYARRRENQSTGLLGNIAFSLQLFADIDYAYSILSDPVTRRRYDRFPQDFLEFHPVPTII